MMYVVKKFIDKLWKEHGFQYETVSFIKDEEFSEFWKQHAKKYYDSLSDELKEDFIVHFPKYIEENQIPKIKDWSGVDKDVLAAWNDYLQIIKKPSYWNGKVEEGILIPLFSNEIEEKYFNYVVQYLEENFKLNGATLSYLYHIMQKLFYGKNKAYIDYCKNTLKIKNFNQIQPRERFGELDPSYQNEISTYRRSAFEKAQNNWNKANENHQFNFKKSYQF